MRFLKTARVIEQEPWYLIRAAEELRRWEKFAPGPAGAGKKDEGGDAEGGGAEVVLVAGLDDAPACEGGDGGVGGNAAQGEGDADGDLPKPDAGSKVLGCPRCYFTPSGCSTCKRPGYKPRKPRPETMAKAHPKAAPKKAAAKKAATAKSKVLKNPGRGKKPGRSTRAKS
eukprot:s105_g33.t1